METPTVESKRYHYRFEEIDEALDSEVELAYVPPPVIEPVESPNFISRLGARIFDTENDRFNILFAVILPIICFVFDPIVFKGNGILSDYRGFAWSLAAVTIVASVITLVMGPRFGAMNAVLAGLFLASGFVSLVIGVALFPISLIATLIVVGLLGFTPLFSAVSMFRLTRRLIKASSSHLEAGQAINIMLFTALATIILPYIFNLEFDKLIDKIF